MAKNHILGLPGSHIAINATAARVIKASSSQDRWAPKPQPLQHFAESSNVLPVAPIPRSAPPELHQVIGRRRDRLTVMGYAADQGDAKDGPAKWVVRCDCGNYEHRTRILRWLGTAAADCCRECWHRQHKLRGGKHAAPLPKATRSTAP